MSRTEPEIRVQNDALHLVMLWNLVIVLAVFRFDIVRSDYDGQLLERRPKSKKVESSTVNNFFELSTGCWLNEFATYW